MAYDTPSSSESSCSTSAAQTSCCGGGCHSEMPAYELSITEAAAKQVKSVATAGQFLRVFVYEGGCAGLKVGFDLDDTTRPGDVEFQMDGARIVADTESLAYIDGTTVDYVSSVAVSRFALVNQNAQAGCGCGSFSKSAA
ncbi:MAG TPA: iron-sulfur cluster assembly accessory protein [Alphaproteobacteria bacterium]|nr:iron-sulfur cluster assembly accessory protein [Alphaproteobacteria bacterium]